MALSLHFIPSYSKPKKLKTVGRTETDRYVTVDDTCAVDVTL